ncbi:MAG: hypothetical protein ACI87O_003187, partial [Planctomycetota bacterium]
VVQLNFEVRLGVVVPVVNQVFRAGIFHRILPVGVRGIVAAKRTRATPLRPKRDKKESSSTLGGAGA